MKRFFSILLLLCFLSLSVGCGKETQDPAGKLTVVATLFPQYDFARQIGGDLAEISLLLPPGSDAHSFDPSASDILKISKADLFLYTGPEMEPWAEKLLTTPELKQAARDLSASVSPILLEDGDTDPHIWTSPVNAEKMVGAICEAFCEADPEHAEEYQKNAEEYKAELEALDREFRDIVSQAKRKTVVFGGRFALTYFTQEYQLEPVAAFDSCSHETEPSVQSMNRIFQEIREKKIPVIYYEEGEEPVIADSICRETGIQKRLFHSCHNLTKEELESGETYLSLMHRNAEYLKEGLWE